MVTLVGPLISTHVEEIIEIVIHTAAENQFEPIVEGCVVRRDNDHASARNEDAVNFTQHSLRRKRMVLHHVGVSHEVKLVIGKRQWLSPNIALLVVNAVAGGYLLKSFCGRPKVHGRSLAPELHCVYCQRAELRSDIQHTGRRSVRRSMTQNITQDSIFPPA